jgi:biopolymer transport protein ExbD
MRSFVKTGKRPPAAIEMTPLIDIVFQLLLFFILTAAASQPGMKVALPGSTMRSADTESSLVITINADGRLFVNNREADLAGVKAAFSDLKNRNPGGSVILNADKTARYGIFFEVIDAAREIGLANLSLGYDEERR